MKAPEWMRESTRAKSPTRVIPPHCGRGRDERNGSSVDGFRGLAALAAGGVWA